MEDKAGVSTRRPSSARRAQHRETRVRGLRPPSSPCSAQLAARATDEAADSGEFRQPCPRLGLQANSSLSLDPENDYSSSDGQPSRSSTGLSAKVQSVVQLLINEKFHLPGAEKNYKHEAQFDLVLPASRCQWKTTASKDDDALKASEIPSAGQNSTSYAVLANVSSALRLASLGDFRRSLFRLLRSKTKNRSFWHDTVPECGDVSLASKPRSSHTCQRLIYLLRIKEVLECTCPTHSCPLTLCAQSLASVAHVFAFPGTTRSRRVPGCPNDIPPQVPTLQL